MSKRKRLLLMVAAALASLGALGLALWLFWPRSPINRASFERIEVGMTLKQVEALLGGPRRDESTSPVVPDVPQHEYLPDFGHFLWRESFWVSDTLGVRVDFDADGRVTRKACIPLRMAESPFDRLRRWLRL
jgi:hypothetical protein